MEAAVRKEQWGHVSISCVEDMRESVLGAGLDVVQLSAGELSGTLAFAVDDGVTYSTCEVLGRISSTGALSENMVSLGLGINQGPGSRQWLDEVETGGIGIFLPGDVHDSIHMPGSQYAVATLDIDYLEHIAADMELVLDTRQLGGSGVSDREISAQRLAPLRRDFVRLHRDRRPRHPRLGRCILETMIRVLARPPRPVERGRNITSYSQIVARAKSYILANLKNPLTVTSIAQAAFVTRATLYRAFAEILDETPQSYVRALRLNRIRRDLADEEEAICSITIVANRWGITELGRFAGRYRQLFGELPSQTKARSPDTAQLKVASAGFSVGR